MESIAELKMENSRNKVALLSSHSSPFENVDSNSFVKTFTDKMRYPKSILILPQNEAFHGLAEMAVRDYYLYYRNRINFIRMNQAILFAAVSRNVSARFQFSNVGIHDYSPTSIVKEYTLKKQETNRSIAHVPIMPIISYGRAAIRFGSVYYVTAEKYFDFLTCDGFQKATLFTVYLEPFDLSIWITAIAANVCLVLILVITYLLLGVASSDRSENEKTKGTVFDAVFFTFYSVSVLLENSFGKLNFSNFGRSVTNMVFLVLAFMCIIFGNLYKSVITTDMIKPTIGTIPYEKFSQIGHFTLIVVPSTDLRVRRNLPRPNAESELRDGKKIDFFLTNSCDLSIYTTCTIVL
jgi:hypothetical protein